MLNLCFHRKDTIIYYMPFVHLAKIYGRKRLFMLFGRFSPLLSHFFDENDSRFPALSVYLPRIH